MSRKSTCLVRHGSDGRLLDQTDVKDGVVRMDELDQIERKCKEVLALRKKRDRYNKPIADAEKQLTKEWDRVKGTSIEVQVAGLFETDDPVESILNAIRRVRAGRKIDDPYAQLPNDLGN